MRVIVHLHTPSIASVVELPSILARAFGVGDREYGAVRRGDQWFGDDGKPVRREVQLEIDREIRAHARMRATSGVSPPT